jgi:homoserine kinase type II
MLMSHFNLVAPIGVEPLVQSGVNNAVWLVRTGAGEFVWKELRHAAGSAAALEYEHWLLGELARQSPPFALPVPVRARDGGTFRHLPSGGLGVLLPRLPGQQVARHDPDEVEAFGEACGALVTALAGVPPRPHPTMASFGSLRGIHPRLSDPSALTPAALGLPETPHNADLFAWWRGLLGQTAAFIAGPYATLPRQMAHSDLAPGNALAVAGRVVAILDFEFAQPDARAIDVAAPLVFVMRLWERTTPAALAMAESFCRGFGRIGTLTAAEIAALPDLVILRNVVSTIWWLGRDLAEGRAPSLGRLTELRDFVARVRAHGETLREIARESLGERQ